jgi:anti-sigma-K factor RskA
VDEAGRTRGGGRPGDVLTSEAAAGLRYEELLDRVAGGVAGVADLEELADLEERSTSENFNHLEDRAASRLSSLADAENLPQELRRRVAEDAGRSASKRLAGRRPVTASLALVIAASLAAIALFLTSTGGRGGSGDGLLARLPLDAARARLLTVSADVGQWPCAGENGRVAGDVVWDNKRQEGYLRLRGIESNDPARTQYQLWIFDESRDERYPVNAGVFDVPQGHVEVVVPIRSALPIRSPNAFAVTEEESGGVVVPDGGRVVALARTSGQ